MFAGSRRAVAQLVSKRDHVLPDKLLVSELLFKVPLNHAFPDGETITLFGRSVTRNDRPLVAPSAEEALKGSRRPYMVYLAGGPGFGCGPPQNDSLTRTALGRGYQVLYLDYRGTGLSTPVTARSVIARGSSSGGKHDNNPTAQAEYLKLFRQDSIVADLEAVRACLTADWPAERKIWSLIGQSFGGFVALTYLSFAPDGLREVFLAGGLAPVGKSPDEVYAATYKHVVARNKAYYEKFPEDVANVRRVVAHIRSHDKGEILLPAGGVFTVPRFLTLGFALGMHAGVDQVHETILRLVTDLDQVGYLTRASLAKVERATPFDDAIYCFAPGVASNWAAHRVGQALPQFRWLASADGDMGPGDNEDDPIFMSGEMIFPFHFETYPELVALSEAAELLARHDTWSALYDEAQLRCNAVPVYAASYVHDMYVDFGLARDTAAMIKGIKVWESNVHYHNALRAKADEVFAALWKLRDDELD